ncbi:hypothetical protein AMATHDRAFT_199708 [Amanita thiersii Skay4041]|uniref:non-specific serine/threonine protein kinase n=1 Tax=Amanita thiersii Skay4041 TaxID=703135 RepID=A0A2A9NDD7_9AGAR|nr:hypothetical protein AMATHDRAFT_199708 [Amanita thiersii Skay4041]
MSNSWLDQFDPLDIIGNGSFGVIRKVRRRSDGTVYARKELNFERMSERDRKQIVAEVNILKDLHHEHIVRYIDRHVDRDAGILYILMEYCGGGDLSAVIKQAAKHNRPIPEDTIWNYFMQILLALQHCHHPNGHARSSSRDGSTAGGGGMGSGAWTDGESGGNGGLPNSGTGGRRVQILHRDLKPDNVFLDENNTVKLGDFGLSKALAQASFANTYVGTPYYMSPELMQEKAYDSKSDIWSLGCLIYELCAMKPPFHEAKTHAELSICIRNGRIPPLPRGYSQSLSNVIKSMLSLNPAMRPSATQLLQHERLELVFKVSETEKMLLTVRTHKSAIASKEREVIARESLLADKEKQINSLLMQKDAEIASLQKMIALAQQQHQQQHQHKQRQYTQPEVELAIKNAVARREAELRVLVMRREEEVKLAMTRREEEIMEAVRRRETEVCEAWARRESEVTKEVQVRMRQMEQRMEAVRQREEELRKEQARLDGVRIELEEQVKRWEEESVMKARKDKTPLEEVKNLLTPLARVPKRRTSISSLAKDEDELSLYGSGLETPVARGTYHINGSHGDGYIPSAMKGVILTSTGEVLATPTPAELASLFNISPKVGLDFTKIFELGSDDEEEGNRDDDIDSKGACSGGKNERERKRPSNVTAITASRTAPVPSSPSRGPVRSRPSFTRTRTAPPPPTATAPTSSTGATAATKKKSGASATATAAGLSGSGKQPHSAPATAPIYDMADEENLPSPFLKRVDRDRVGTSGGKTGKTGTKRPSTGTSLRVVAATNNAAAGKRTTPTPSVPSSPTRHRENHTVTGAGLSGAASRVTAASAAAALRGRRKSEEGGKKMVPAGVAAAPVRS